MTDYYVPMAKSELIGELIKEWPKDKARFKKMDRRRLIAIFHQLRRSQLGIKTPVHYYRSTITFRGLT